MTYAHIESAGPGRGSLRSILAGFFISLLLTGIPFALVMSGALSSPAIYPVIFGAGFLQILVQLHCFLHLDFSRAGRWNLAATIFTLLIVMLFVGGSIWIMWDLYSRMM